MIFNLFRNAALNFEVANSPTKVLLNFGKEISRRNLKGKATESVVVLKLLGILPHRPYQPTFRGVVTPSGGGAKVSGQIKYPLSLRVFTWFFLGFSVFWTLGAFLATQGDEKMRWMPLAGVVFFAAGVGFFKMLTSIVERRLMDGLKAEIRNAAERVV